MPVSLFYRGPAARFAAGIALLLAWGTAGCGADGGDGLPPAPSPGASTLAATPMSQLTPEEQRAVDEVRRLFDEFMRAYVDLATSGEPPGDDAMLPIGTRSIPPIFSAVNTELVDNYQAGRHLSGTLGWEYLGAADVRLDPGAASGDSRSPQVLLRYCLDAADWSTVDSARDVRVSGEGFISADAQLGTVRAIFFDRGGPEDPRWYLAEWMEEAGSAC